MLSFLPSQYINLALLCKWQRVSHCVVVLCMLFIPAEIELINLHMLELKNMLIP